MHYHLILSHHTDKKDQGNNGFKSLLKNARKATYNNTCSPLFLNKLNNVNQLEILAHISCNKIV